MACAKESEMTKLTELPNKWIDEICGDISGSLAHALRHCANDLSNSLPVWTEFTNDKPTWPEEGQTTVAYGHTDTQPFIVEFYAERSIVWLAYRIKWRPLCSIDFPPEKVDE